LNYCFDVSIKKHQDSTPPSLTLFEERGGPLARTRRWISTAGIRQKIKKYLTKIWNFDRKSSQWQLYLDGRFWSIFQTVRSFLNQELYVAEMVPRWSSSDGGHCGTISAT